MSAIVFSPGSLIQTAAEVRETMLQKMSHGGKGTSLIVLPWQLV